MTSSSPPGGHRSKFDNIDQIDVKFYILKQFERADWEAILFFQRVNLASETAWGTSAIDEWLLAGLG